MSALPSIAVSDRPRHMRLARPVDAGTLPPPERRVYRPGDGEVPVPPALATYVRGPAHFARVLGALTGMAGSEAGMRHYEGADLTCAQEVLRLFSDCRPRADGGPVGLHDRDAAKLLLSLFPPVPCGRCGRPYLADGRRRAYCGDACRRKAAAEAAERRRKE